ncbi:RNA polymerase sigma factor [Terriglobus sp. ADX1]|uniref:RNA polymerase sigma factor n=1 Tax=Terriglobus sp. ADX1 TaxID=2794063 RepID=UPI002FE561CF
MSFLSSSTDGFFDASATLVSAEETLALQSEVLSLYDTLHSRLLRYAVSFGLSVPDGEDVLQEVFLALFRHLRAGRSRENLPGWAYRTTHNLSLKRRASVHAEQKVTVVETDAEMEVSDHQPGPEETVLFQERQQRLRSVVEALTETDRMCLLLRSDGLRYREIASTLGISLGSVAASLARSFDRLQRMEQR